MQCRLLEDNQDWFMSLMTGEDANYYLRKFLHACNFRRCYTYRKWVVCGSSLLSPRQQSQPDNMSVSTATHWCPTPQSHSMFLLSSIRCALR